MEKLVVLATTDVPDPPLHSLVRAIGQTYCVVSSSRLSLCSAEPPSYIEVIGSLITWRTVLVASATVFFGKLAKRLADDVYESGSAIAGGLFKPLRRVATALAQSLRERPERSFLKVTLSNDEGNISASISFSNESRNEIAFKLACLYAVSEQIIDRLSDVATEYHGRVMPPSISISKNGDVTVRCYAGVENDNIEFTISIR